MASLYDELLSNIGKTASVADLKQGLDKLDTGELIALAQELETLAAPNDREEMAKILPVFASGNQVEKEVAVEQTIQNVKPAEVVMGVDNKDDLSVMASQTESTVEKQAEEDKKEKDKKDEDKKEEDKKDEDKKESSDEKKEDKEEDKKEASASEILYSLLKEGAALEELIEARAAEMVDDLMKQAEDYQAARQIVDQGAVALTDNIPKAHEYAEQMIDKAKTIAATNDIPMSEAASAVVSTVLDKAQAAGKVAAEDVAMFYSIMKEAAEVGESQVGAGATQGAKWGAGMGTASTAANLAMRSAMGLPITKAELAGMLALGIPLSALMGAGSGAIHGHFMDNAEEKAVLRGEEYDPVAAGKKVGLIGGAVTGMGIGALPGYLVGNSIGKKVQEDRAKTAEEYFEELSKASSELEATYEKIAAEAGEVAEAILMQAGQKQGLVDPQLHDFVQRGLEEIKTVAAKLDCNLAEAAKAYLSGNTGSVAGVVEPIVPSPAQAPSPVKAPINSNQTQSPDEYIPAMVANADPNVASATKQAEVVDYVKNLLKEAMINSIKQ